MDDVNGTVLIEAHGGKALYLLDESGIHDVFNYLETTKAKRLDDFGVKQELPALWCGVVQRKCSGGHCADCHMFPGGR